MALLEIRHAFQRYKYNKVPSLPRVVGNLLEHHSNTKSGGARSEEKFVVARKAPRMSFVDYFIRERNIPGLLS